MTNKKIVLASIAVIVAAGLMALNPSMIGNAQAQLYANDYGYENNYYQDDNRYGYDKKDQKSSHTDIQKIKCVNSNINVNGIDITQIPQDDTATAAANEGSDATGAQNGNGWGDKINFDRNLVNVCVNVNDNEQVKVSPPEEANLLVTKTVTCEMVSGTSVPSVQQAIGPCDILKGEITEDLFDISVSGTSINPVPSQFQGSETGQNVVLGTGSYTVTETPAESVATIVSNLEEGFIAEITGPIASFDEDCTQSDPFEATGTIAAEDSQTCEITNHFVIS